MYDSSSQLTPITAFRIEAKELTKSSKGTSRTNFGQPRRTEVSRSNQRIDQQCACSLGRIDEPKETFKFSTGRYWLSSVTISAHYPDIIRALSSQCTLVELTLDLNFDTDDTSDTLHPSNFFAEFSQNLNGYMPRPVTLKIGRW